MSDWIAYLLVGFGFGLLGAEVRHWAPRVYEVAVNIYRIEKDRVRDWWQNS